ncbi:MAG TPA: hypothetical protein VJL59_12540, partial [Anaerolineales bacterium]|nr:hypothetical protein [Anaerolineales bacterium]
MTQSFNCPHCNAPLDYEGGDLTVRCPYCSSSVIVPESLRAAPQNVTPHAPSLPVVGMDSLLSQAARLKEVARLIRSGNKIEAIKIYRETFDVSLTEAKDAVDKMAAGQPVIMPGSAPVTTRSAQSVSNEAFARAEISRLIQQGSKIEAIKLYREKTGAGLKESKDAVEAFEAGGPLIFVQGPGTPDITANFTPPISTVTTSGTYSTTPKRQGSFLGAWIGFSFGAFWMGFIAAMLGMFAFPGLVRFAAPIACPKGYVDAYGERVFNYYDEASSTSVDGAALLKCVNSDGKTVVAHPFFVFFIMFGGTWLAGIVLAFGLAALSRFRVAGCVPLVGALFVLGVGAYFYSTKIPSTSNLSIMSLVFGRSESGSEAVSIPDLLTTVVPPPTPAPSPTPSLVDEVWAIGSEGTGPGQFTDPRYLAIDGDGNIYVADHVQGSRVQVFDADGNFVTQWKTKEDAYLTGLAADRNGIVYVLQPSTIYRYDGATGTLLGQVEYDDRIAAITVTAEGELVAAARDAFVRFDADGQPVMTTAGSLDKMVGEDSFSFFLDDIAVDRRGNIYAVSPF